MTDTESAESERDRDNDRIQKVLEAHVAQIMEHVDSVQIIATKFHNEANTTAVISRGGGNWFAREGACREWVLKNEEESRDSVRKDNQ